MTFYHALLWLYPASFRAEYGGEMAAIFARRWRQSDRLASRVALWFDAVTDVVRNAPRDFRRTLEIGPGLGEHLEHERLTDAQAANYYAVDIRDNMAADIKRRFPRINTVVADCQKRMAFEDGFFDRIIAIHVLEHLPDLPAAIRELHRVCDKARGVLSIVIPCEGSLAYSFARSISAKPMFERRYGQPYDTFIKREHINLPHEIFEEIAPYFVRRQSTYFPLPVPLEFCNLCIGATFAPREVVGVR